MALWTSKIEIKTKKTFLYNYLQIDSILSVSGINNDLFKMLEDISPFGSENPKPIFALKNVKIIKPKIVGESENHISFYIFLSTPHQPIHQE